MEIQLVLTGLLAGQHAGVKELPPSSGRTGRSSPSPDAAGVCDDADVAGGHLSWQQIVTRLAPERTYWLLTIARDGLPHAAPVWGAVVDDTWFFYSERVTVKSRNLARDPRLVLHLPDGEDVAIIHGEARDLGHPQQHPAVVAAFAAKYTRLADRALLPGADPAFDVLYALRPMRAMTWRLDDYERSQRRWSAAHTEDGAPHEIEAVAPQNTD